MARHDELLKSWRKIGLPGNPFDEEGNWTPEGMRVFREYQQQKGGGQPLPQFAPQPAPQPAPVTQPAPVAQPIPSRESMLSRYQYSAPVWPLSAGFEPGTQILAEPGDVPPGMIRGQVPMGGQRTIPELAPAPVPTPLPPLETPATPLPQFSWLDRLKTLEGRQPLIDARRKKAAGQPVEHPSMKQFRMLDEALVEPMTAPVFTGGSWLPDIGGMTGREIEDRILKLGMQGPGSDFSPPYWLMTMARRAFEEPTVAQQYESLREQDPTGDSFIKFRTAQQQAAMQEGLRTGEISWQEELMAGAIFDPLWGAGKLAPLARAGTRLAQKAIPAVTRSLFPRLTMARILEGMPATKSQKVKDAVQANLRRLIDAKAKKAKVPRGAKAQVLKNTNLSKQQLDDFIEEEAGAISQMEALGDMPVTPTTPRGPMEEIEELVADLSQTTPIKALAGEGTFRHLEGRIREKFGQMVAGEKMAGPQSLFHKPGSPVVLGKGPGGALEVIATHTGRTVDEIEDLVLKARRELAEQAGATVVTPRRRRYKRRRGFRGGGGASRIIKDDGTYDVASPEYRLAEELMGTRKVPAERRPVADWTREPTSLYDPTLPGRRGVPKRVTDITTNPKIKEVFHAAITAGNTGGKRGAEWYLNPEIRNALVGTYGKEKGQSLYELAVGMIASTSPGAKVPANVKMGAGFYYGLAKPVREAIDLLDELNVGLDDIVVPSGEGARFEAMKGAYAEKVLEKQAEVETLIRKITNLELLPEAGSGVGHKYQNQHAKNVAAFLRGDWKDLDNVEQAKVRSFFGSLMGSPDDVALDIHAMRFIGMNSGNSAAWLGGMQPIARSHLYAIAEVVGAGAKNPRAIGLQRLKRRELYSEGTDREGNKVFKFNARDAVIPLPGNRKGYIDIEVVRRIPSVYRQTPSKTEYAALRDFFGELGVERIGIDGKMMLPSQVQASLWIGAAEQTGVAAGSQQTFINIFRAFIIERGKKKGITNPVEAAMDWLQEPGGWAVLLALLTTPTLAELSQAGMPSPDEEAPEGALSPEMQALISGTQIPEMEGQPGIQTAQMGMGGILKGLGRIGPLIEKYLGPLLRRDVVGLEEGPPMRTGWDAVAAGEEVITGIPVSMRAPAPKEGPQFPHIPSVPAMGPLQDYIHQSESTMGRILRQTVPGETPEQGLISTYEGAINVFANDMKLLQLEKQRHLLDMGVGTLVEGRWVPRPEDKPALLTLFRALHDHSRWRNIATKYKQDFPELKRLVGKEEALRIDFDPELATVDDYFFRGWKPPDDLLKAAGPDGSVGNIPGFTLPRNGATFEEMIEKGFEPLFWNPYEMYAHTAKIGNKYRLQTQLINDFRTRNSFDVQVIKKGDRLMENGDWVVDNKIYRGYKIPRVGPAFEGRAAPITGPGRMAGGTSTGKTHLGVIVPKEIANRLETVFGRRPRWRVELPGAKILGPLKGKGVDVYPYIFNITYVPKRIKLYGSLFQQRDFIQRNYGSAWTLMLREMKNGNFGEGLMKLAWWPKEGLWDIAKSNLNPKYREEILKWYASTDEILAGRPGITPRALVNAGLSTIDVTLLPPDMFKLVREAYLATGKRVDKKAVRWIREMESAMRRGLFEGVYPTAMKVDIVNNIAPMYARMYPHLTDEQLAGVIARAANIRYSTIPASQSVVQLPWLRDILKLFFFSLGESEGLIRQATRAISGPDAAYWRWSALGTYVSMVATADAIHLATTGNHMPIERFIPVDFDPEWELEGDEIGHWLNKPTPFGYQRDFASPDIPVTDRTGEQQLTLDMMGQMDTVLRMFNPGDWIVSRRSVPITALTHQLSNKDFYDRLITTPGMSVMDQITARTTQLISDVGVPIGVGQSALQLAREHVPGVEGIIPQEGARLGMAGQLIKGTGILVRSPVTPDLRDLMVSKVAEGDPGAARLGIEPGKKWNDLGLEAKNYVEASPLNKGLMEEVELRGEEQALSMGDPVNVWYVNHRGNRDAHFAKLTEDAEKALTKRNPHIWYKEKASRRAREYAIIQEAHTAQGKKDFGDDFLDRVRKGLTPQQQLEEDFFGLLYSDDAEVYAKYFPGKSLVPLEDEDGDFNSVEYERRIQILNTEAGDPNFVRGMKDAILDRKVRQGLPEMERQRLQERDYIAEHYWRASTDEGLLALMPSDEVREAWINYVAMSDADRGEEDDTPGSIASTIHEVGTGLFTFESLYGSAAIRKVRERARRNDPELEAKLMRWGYVSVPVGGSSFEEIIRGGAPVRLPPLPRP